VIEKLTKFCRLYDRVQTNDNLEYALSVSYGKGRIIIFEIAGEILGYVESWRINFEQFGRIICHAGFPLDTEDIEHGNICYLANTAIHPDYRDSFVVKWLKERFFEQNEDAEYFVGEAIRKKHQPVKVFKNKHIREVIKHG
jgi:ribosomal protein S18 acetylase RimI-like enzyme